jgi:hypothetical protein
MLYNVLDFMKRPVLTASFVSIYGREKNLHFDSLKYFSTRISGPYGPQIHLHAMHRFKKNIFSQKHFTTLFVLINRGLGLTKSTHFT